MKRFLELNLVFGLLLLMVWIGTKLIRFFGRELASITKGPFANLIDKKKAEIHTKRLSKWLFIVGLIVIILLYISALIQNGFIR